MDDIDKDQLEYYHRMARMQQQISPAGFSTFKESPSSSTSSKPTEILPPQKPTMQPSSAIADESTVPSSQSISTLPSSSSKSDFQSIKSLLFKEIRKHSKGK
jgi:hypothetical protein